MRILGGKLRVATGVFNGLGVDLLHSLALDPQEIQRRVLGSTDRVSYRAHSKWYQAMEMCSQVFAESRLREAAFFDGYPSRAQRCTVGSHRSGLRVSRGRIWVSVQVPDDGWARQEQYQKRICQGAARDESSVDTTLDEPRGGRGRDVEQMIMCLVGRRALGPSSRRSAEPTYLTWLPRGSSVQGHRRPLHALMLGMQIFAMAKQEGQE